MIYACPCVKKHNPVPRSLEAHYVIPVEWGGSPTSDNQAWLCPTSHHDLHVLLDSYVKSDPPSKPVMNHYPVFVRQMARKAREGAREDQLPLNHTLSGGGFPIWCEQTVDPAVNG